MMDLQQVQNEYAEFSKLRIRPVVYEEDTSILSARKSIQDRWAEQQREIELRRDIRQSSSSCTADLQAGRSPA